MQFIFYLPIVLWITTFLFPSPTQASVWPVFSSPDKAFLLNNNYIDTHQCPAGEGKLISPVQINIHYSLCHTYCPDTWAWISMSDARCHNLSTEFNFQHYEIQHYKDDDGTTLYSIVTAFYGPINSSSTIFSFTFISPKENWFCIESELDTITCANDT